MKQHLLLQLQLAVLAGKEAGFLNWIKKQDTRVAKQEKRNTYDV